MGKVVSIINWKGGVGKSTLTLHLSAGLRAYQGKKVLMIDLDPQCNLSFLAVGVSGYVEKVYDERIKTLKDLFDSYFNDTIYNREEIIHAELVNAEPGYVYNNLDMVLSHQELVLVDLQLARNRKAGKDHKEDTKNEIEKLSIIHNLLKDIKDEYDYILLDCPPNVNIVTQNAFYASDYFVIPAIPDFLSTTGISLIVDYMEKFNKSFKGMHDYAEIAEAYIETEFAGIIFNMVDEYGGSPKQTHLDTIITVKSQHPGMVFENYLTDGDGISAASVNLPVYAVNSLPRSQPNATKQTDYLQSIVAEFSTKLR